MNNTNLDYFDPVQKSDLMQMKGEVLMRLGQMESADKSFATAIALNKNSENAWRGWGKVWDANYLYGADMRFLHVSLTMILISSNPSGPAETKQKNLVHSVNAYMQSTKIGSHNQRRVLSRVFWLLGESALTAPKIENDDGEVPIEEDKDKPQQVQCSGFYICLVLSFD